MMLCEPPHYHRFFILYYNDEQIALVNIKMSNTRPKRFPLRCYKEHNLELLQAEWGKAMTLLESPNKLPNIKYKNINKFLYNIGIYPF